VIEFKNVSKRYPCGHQALQHINLHLPRGKMAFLTGHSGAGKSTLLRIIALIERSTTGQVIVNQIPYHQLQARHIPYIRRNLGIIFQDPKLLYDRSVFDNVALPLMIHGYRYQDIGKRVRAALDKVGLLRKEKLLPSHLSCGEQQRIGIARAVVHKPQLLLADEPTGNLDPELSKEIMELFVAFNQVGMTQLIASHDINLLAQFKCQTITLADGQLQ
jgi:cell division transport system ATP-binding protein